MHGAGFERLHVVLVAIEAMGGHHPGVLQAVRHHQGAGLVDVALFEQQFDDGGGGDGIKAGGG